MPNRLTIFAFNMRNGVLSPQVDLQHPKHVLVMYITIAMLPAFMLCGHHLCHRQLSFLRIYMLNWTLSTRSGSIHSLAFIFHNFHHCFVHACLVMKLFPVTHFIFTVLQVVQLNSTAVVIVLCQVLIMFRVSAVWVLSSGARVWRSQTQVRLQLQSDHRTSRECNKCIRLKRHSFE